MEWLLGVLVVLIGCLVVLCYLTFETLSAVQKIEEELNLQERPSHASASPTPGTSWLMSDRELKALENQLESDSRQRQGAGFSRSRSGFGVKAG
jgi:hypothetical protein